MSDYTRTEESTLNDLANTFVSLGKSECAATLRISLGIIVNRLNQKESEGRSQAALIRKLGEALGLMYDTGIPDREQAKDEALAAYNEWLKGQDEKT